MTMPESWYTRLERIGFNFFPAVFGTGATVTYIASDYREVRVRLPLSWRTRNYVGTIFGGSMYAATDPIYMVMLYKLLGSNYIIWDKAATIRFRKPGRATLYATCIVDTTETQAIQETLETRPSIDRVYQIELTDAEGVVHASIEKTVCVGRKNRTAA